MGYGTIAYSVDIICAQQYPNQTSGRQTVTFTTPTDLADGKYLFVRFARTLTSSSATVDISSVQLEEGTEATSYEEYGALPSPEYPSEVKSMGDLVTSDNCSTYGNDACDNIGKYVIQVKSSGKNLIPYPYADSALKDNVKVDEWNNSERPFVVNCVLENPTEEKVDLPSIDTLSETSTLSINSEVGPSNIRLTTSK